MKRGHQLRAALVGAALIAAAIPAITAGRPSSSPTAYATPGHAATVRTSTVSTGSTPATVECAGIAAAPPGPPYPIPNQPWTPGLAAAVINSVGVTDFPASYGGMELTGDRDLVIYLAGQDPALVAEVDSSPRAPACASPTSASGTARDTWGPSRNAWPRTLRS
jgi:hypothetical protein